MNRQIKFRAWDADMNEIVMVSGIQFNAHSPKEKPNIIDEHNDMHDLDEVVLMQFTGLKDKNGNDIYEGDIVCHTVTDGSTVKNIIVFEEGSFKMKLMYEIATLTPKDWSVHTEIIGNIFENPELIKST